LAKDRVFKKKTAHTKAILYRAQELGLLHDLATDNSINVSTTKDNLKRNKNKNKQKQI